MGAETRVSLVRGSALDRRAGALTHSQQVHMAYHICHMAYCGLWPAAAARPRCRSGGLHRTALAPSIGGHNGPPAGTVLECVQYLDTLAL